MSRPIPIFSMIPFMAAARFDSESKRKVAEATTVSPAATPRVTRISPSPRFATTTSLGMTSPPRITKARSRSPVGRTAVSGTSTPLGPVERIRTVPYMFGLSRKSRLRNSRRTLSVRVRASRVG